MQIFRYFSKATAEIANCGFFVALVLRSLVVVIGTASLKAWQTKTLHVFPHSLLIVALRFADWTVILFPQTAHTVCSL